MARAEPHDRSQQGKEYHEIDSCYSTRVKFQFRKVSVRRTPAPRLELRLVPLVPKLEVF